MVTQKFVRTWVVQSGIWSFYIFEIYLKKLFLHKCAVCYELPFKHKYNGSDKLCELKVRSGFRTIKECSGLLFRLAQHICFSLNFLLTSPEAAEHINMEIGNIYASFNTGYLSHSLMTMTSIAQWVECARPYMYCIGGAPRSMLGEKNSFLYLSLFLCFLSSSLSDNIISF